MRIFQRKAFQPAVSGKEGHGEAHMKNYNIFDLICVGVGATLGSGVFVLTGLVSREYAGPGAVFSWILAGTACCFSAMSYAEMSNRMPSAGSAYTFVYATLGELPAYIAGWCLSLECGISGASVARSWGVKLTNYFLGLNNELPEDELGFNFYAFAIMVATVLLFLVGTEVSRITINIFTVGKVFLVFFMIITGLCLFKPSHLTNFTPYGVRGCLRGATSCFFGYVGYDEVCCMALETKDAKRTLPVAVFGTISIVTALYALSSLSLTGMREYAHIDGQSGFSEAFTYNHYKWAANITAIGELVTLPLVVMVSFLPQARICYSMALDSLAPSLFLYRDSSGNFTGGIIFCGIICILIASFVPFIYLDDVISAGVLFSFNLTNNSLIMIRSEDDEDIPWPNLTALSNWSRCNILLFLYNIQCLTISVLITLPSDTDDLMQDDTPASSSGNTDSGGYQNLRIFAICFGICLLLLIAVIMGRDCIEPLLRKQAQAQTADQAARELYRVPFMPYPPLLGLFINYFLIAQLKMESMIVLICYFLVATVVYFLTRNTGNIINNNNNSNTGSPSNNNNERTFVYNAIIHSPRRSALSRE
jgi:APA family basic amino acid/polyamine antiporter